MFDTSMYPQAGTYPQAGMYPQAGLHGLPQLGQQGPFGQPQLPGFVPIVSLVPQSLIVSLVVQSLQQAQLAALGPQGALGHLPGQFAGQFGIPQLGGPIGQFQQSPWQSIGGWGGQSPYAQSPFAGAFGRGVLGAQAPHMAYAGQSFGG